MAFQEYSKRHLKNINQKSIDAVLSMAAEGSTVPFMARYRKEKTGNLDEVQIRLILDTHARWEELEKRRAFILEEVGKQDNLTPELTKQIMAADLLAELEEIYRPFKKKKKTKAKLAMDAGITPLADWIWALAHGEHKETDSLEVKAKGFINAAAKFATYEEVLRGAHHIISERLYNNVDLRKMVKDDFFATGVLVSEKGKSYKTNSKYSTYADFKEPVTKLQSKKASHRYLAIRRGWTESELKVSIVGNNEALLKKFEEFANPNKGHQADNFMLMCAKAALEVHVIPSVTNELHTLLKEKSDEHSIEVFADNVRQVLMASPFGAKVVLGVDPGIRTGCKVALVDNSGRFLTDTVLHTTGDGALEKAKKLLGETIKQVKIEAIAVGNGTGGREAESFLRKALKELKEESIPIVMVNESGASVYSASEVAREEFPDLDLTVRGAISIARRLQDPLSELVKIEPKSIGVGQYQHDVGQSHLKKSLHDVVESCVNSVGVDLNTASSSLLQYVSGIGPATAKNIVEHRSTIGLFEQRQDLMKVPKFGAKAYEQAAGFLRIPNSKVPLDKTGIHPERYQAVNDMLKDAGLTLSQVMGGDVSKLKEKKEKWTELMGQYTYEDVLTELSKPGRDPRDPYKVFQYRDDIHEVKDLKEDMVCPGIVTNVTNFGAFVDIGVHQDGLVHLSQLTHEFVEDPRTVVNPGDQVKVKVLGVDSDKNQISLTMLLTEKPKAPARKATGKKKAKGKSKPSKPKQTFNADRGKELAAKKPQGGKAKGGKGPRRDNDRKPRKPSSPFNNPFAALADLKKD